MEASRRFGGAELHALTADGDLLERLRRALAPEYTVERVIATGGMGRVFAGHDVALGRPVAIKVLRPEFAHPSAVRRLAREAQILAMLEHPAIVPVYKVEESEGLYCVIMRYMPGETLEQRLLRGPLPLEDVCNLGRDILDALGAAHRLDVVHRDVKPGNIFLADGRALLGDFGISKSLVEDASAVNHPVGTPGYAPPEQMSGGALTPQSDLYALGVVLYEAAAGRRFFASGLYDRHRWKNVPRRLARVLQRAAAWAPEERWPDASAFQQALSRARPRRWGRVAALAAVAVVLAVLGYRVGRTAPRGEPAAHPVNLAMLPLESGDPGDTTGHQLARYAATRLEWFSPITFRPATFSFAWWDAASAARRVSDAPRTLNADRYVEGEITGSGSERIATARVRNRSGDLVQTVRVPDLGTGLLPWGQALADSLVRRTYPDRYPAFKDLGAAGGSTDQFAVNAFIAGENAFHRDAYAAAETHFKEALDLDPQFAIAAWHLALMRRWLRVPFQADLRRLAAAEGLALPLHYRALLNAQLEPDLATRLAKYRAAVDSFPDDGYGLLLYADELFHRGPLIGLGLDTALRVMTTAAGKDPYLDLSPALDHIIWGRLRLGDEDGAEAAVTARLRASRVTVEGSAEAAERLDLLRLAYHERFHPVWARVLRFTLLRRPSRAQLLGLANHLRLALLFDIPESERALGAILVRSALDDSMAAQGHQAQGIALMALGRPRAGLAHLDSAAALFGGSAGDLDRAEWRLLPARLGLPGAIPEEEAWARSRLSEIVRDSALGARAAWALALDATLTGRQEDARQWQKLVTSTTSASPAAKRLSALLLGAEAGDVGAATEALRRTEVLATTEVTTPPDDPFARAALFLLRGRWLQSLGQFAAAERSFMWYENSDGEGYPQGRTEPVDVDAVLSVQARVLRGRLAFQEGDRVRACTGLRRVRELWADADPALNAARAEVDSMVSQCRR